MKFAIATITAALIATSAAAATAPQDLIDMREGAFQAQSELTTGDKATVPADQALLGSDRYSNPADTINTYDFSGTPNGNFGNERAF